MAAAGLLAAFGRCYHNTLVLWCARDDCRMLGMAALGILTLSRRRLWPIPLFGSISFALLYIVVLEAAYTLWPHFLAQWTADRLWGLSVLGMPAEEVVWAFSFGGVWPLLMAYGFDSHLRPR
jgi:hypothetical protein